MKLKKIVWKIFVSGIWTQPIVYFVLVRMIRSINPNLIDIYEVKYICVAISLLPFMFLFNVFMNEPREEAAITGKEQAMRPPVNKKLLYRKPQGIFFGKHRSKYVCRDVNEDGHVLLIGGTGSGKSSRSVINTILCNPTVTMFSIDIKGELSFKATKYGSKKVRIFNPQDRDAYGYNPLYGLSDKSTGQEIYERMQLISFSLIAMPASLKDPFWKNSSRNLLIGMLVYYFKQGSHSFVEIVDQILSAPIKEQIEAILNNSRKTSVEYRYIVGFKDMEEETLGGIVGEMNNHLQIFANDQDIRYAFKDSAHKISPKTLLKGKSIFISIREEKLTAYYDVLQMIINQMLAELEKRPEDSKPIIFIIDELPRILSAGKIDRLLDAARTLRSRKVTLFLITQSVEALMIAFSESEAMDIISNCPYVIVLNASSSKTQKMICDWAGKYRARRKSWNFDGMETSRSRVSINYEEKNILEPADLKKLGNDAILFSPYGYNRIKKCAYYSDKYFKPLSEACVKHNKAILEMRRECDCNG